MSLLKRFACVLVGTLQKIKARRHSATPQSMRYIAFNDVGRRSRNSVVFDVTFPAFLLFAAIVLQYSSLDIWIASHFYDSITASWPYKHTWPTESVIHDGGRIAAFSLGSIPFIAFALTFFVKTLRRHRRAACFLVLATALGPLLVSALKSVTHIYSPWDLAIFGGKYEVIRLLDSVPVGAPVGHAFPAGHASAGFAFVSIYFLLRVHAPRYQHFALMIAIVIGGIFGLDQQIRGAHMLSHDLVALAVCWSSAAFMVSFILRPCRRKAPVTVPLNIEPDLELARIREPERVDARNSSR